MTHEQADAAAREILHRVKDQLVYLIRKGYRPDITLTVGSNTETDFTFSFSDDEIMT